MGTAESKSVHKTESPITSFFSNTTLKVKGTAAEDKDTKLQRALENEITKRNADIKMLKMRNKDHVSQMNAELILANSDAAYQHHVASKNINAQIQQIQVCTAKLQKELSALYTHKMHASTMALMKATSRHFVKSTAAAGSVDNAIEYADNLADAHSTVEEVADALTYGDTAEVDESWQKIMHKFNAEQQKEVSKDNNDILLVAAAANVPDAVHTMTKPPAEPNEPAKKNEQLTLGL